MINDGALGGCLADNRQASSLVMSQGMSPSCLGKACGAALNIDDILWIAHNYYNL
jgi:hypothetical protein